MKKLRKSLIVFMSLCLVMMSVCLNISADSIDPGEARNNVNVEVKDMESFKERFIADFRIYHGEFKDDREKQDIIVWEYPYGSIVRGNITESYSNLNFVYLYLNAKAPDYMWAFFENMDGTKGWVCLNAPDDEDMQFVDVGYNVETKNNKTSIKVLVLVVVLVVILMLFTGIVIWMIWKDKSKKEGKTIKQQDGKERRDR